MPQQNRPEHITASVSPIFILHSSRSLVYTHFQLKILPQPRAAQVTVMPSSENSRCASSAWERSYRSNPRSITRCQSRSA